jgi:DNA-binding transcriptional LysR family regulator
VCDDYNLYPLKVFVTVARLRSVTLAAAELKVTQPAVSAHLRSIEERYGGKLFDRSSRGMILTSLGEMVLNHTNILMSNLAIMRSEIEMSQGIVRGEFTIAASNTPGAYLLPHKLKEFKALHPSVDPIVSMGNSSDVVEQVEAYRAQIGVCGELTKHDWMDSCLIGTDQLSLYSSSSDPLVEMEKIDDRQLANRTLFVREPRSSTRKYTEAMLQETFRCFHRTQEISQVEAIKQMVIAGLGVAVLSSQATRLECEHGLLRPVKDHRFRKVRSLYCIKRSDRNMQGPAGAFWDYLTHMKQDETVAG